MQTAALRERPDMSDGMKIKRAKHVSLRPLHLFQCLQISIQKSDNAIPNSYHFCVMGSNGGSAKPSCLSKKYFLLDESVLIFWF